MRRPWRHISAVPSLALLLVAVACARDDSAALWAGIIETLPGGAVRVTNPSSGLWSGDDSWQLQRELVLGETDGESAAVFGSISGLEVGESGDIYVLDRQANELRIFGHDGTHLRTVGRSGEGPGEYSKANGLAWLNPDTLLVVDQEGNRYSILNQRGDYIRSVLRRLAFFGWVFRGGVDGDLVYELSHVGSDEDSRPVLLGTRLRADSVQSEIVVDASEASEDAPRFMADTLLLARPDGPLYEAFSIRTERGGMVMGVPFAGTPQYYLDGANALWQGHGGNPRIYHTTLAGDTLIEVILDTEPASVTPEEIDEWQAQPAIDRFKSLGGKLDLSRIPALKPYFDGILLDSEGNIWLTVPTAPQQAAFAVLDTEGRYLGQLRIDGVEREVYVPPVARNSRLYFVGRDEFDVQRVYVYRVRKPGTQTAQTTSG